MPYCEPGVNKCNITLVRDIVKFVQITIKNGSKIRTKLYRMDNSLNLLVSPLSIKQINLPITGMDRLLKQMFCLWRVEAGRFDKLSKFFKNPSSDWRERKSRHTPACSDRQNGNLIEFAERNGRKDFTDKDEITKNRIEESRGHSWPPVRAVGLLGQSRKNREPGNHPGPMVYQRLLNNLVRERRKINEKTSNKNTYAHSYDHLNAHVRERFSKYCAIVGESICGIIHRSLLCGFACGARGCFSASYAVFSSGKPP